MEMKMGNDIMNKWVDSRLIVCKEIELKKRKQHIIFKIPHTYIL